MMAIGAEAEVFELTGFQTRKYRLASAPSTRGPLNPRDRRRRLRLGFPEGGEKLQIFPVDFQGTNSLIPRYEGPPPPAAPLQGEPLCDLFLAGSLSPSVLPCCCLCPPLRPARRPRLAQARPR